MTTALDEVSFTGISATTAPFNLKGGFYMVFVVATFNAGSVELQALGPDQSTYLSVPAALPVGAALKLTANGTISGYLPPGIYKFVVTTATGVSCSVGGVPIS